MTAQIGAQERGKRGGGGGGEGEVRLEGEAKKKKRTRRGDARGEGYCAGPDRNLPTIICPILRVLVPFTHSI